MNVFISWSGERSKLVAAALRAWLPKVVQAVKPWMSNEDIAAGKRWSPEIAESLQKCQHGIICLTQENLDKAWINFEAGALSKIVSDARVCPYLLGLSPTDVVGPMSQFQSKAASKQGTIELLMSINATSTAPLAAEDLLDGFKMWWPTLEEKLNAIPEPKKSKPSRSERELLEEILTLVRSGSFDLNRIMAKRAEVPVEVVGPTSTIGTLEIDPNWKASMDPASQESFYIKLKNYLKDSEPSLGPRKDPPPAFPPTSNPKDKRF